MRNLIYILILSFISVSSFADDCDINTLNEYKIILTDNSIQKDFEGKIYLPNLKSIKGEFCGFWLQEKLTNNKVHQLTGYLDNHLNITLNPEAHDLGFALDFDNTNTWLQQGTLIKRGIAGIKIGTFKIVAN